VRSTTETFGVGTRKAIPVNFPFKSGITFPTLLNTNQIFYLRKRTKKKKHTALAAPVDDGIMFCAAPRPPLQSYINKKNIVFVFLS
jgi:20S proteasome alpha/beta subunit